MEKLAKVIEAASRAKTDARFICSIDWGEDFGFAVFFIDMAQTEGDPNRIIASAIKADLNDAVNEVILLIEHWIARFKDQK